MMKKHNFNAGPAILPQPVLEQSAEAVLDFNGIGLSILEISHRSPEFTGVLNEAEALVRDLLELDEAYAVLFLQGGASTQFFMSAMNLLNEDERAGYIDTGSWSAKAIKEARHFGNIDVLASSKSDGYTYIPKDFDIPDGLRYVHLTSNNTIYGTEFHDWPETEARFVADMSSDIFSRPIDAGRFDLIYAGAQKNLGPAGVTLVIVRREALGKVRRTLPSMLDYRIHIDKKSSYNTPPVFPIYVLMLTLRWIKADGGLEAMALRAEERARVLYEEIDRNPLFRGTVSVKDDRSLMNATFVMAQGKEDLEAPFLATCKEAGIAGIKGHRSVGGFRASIYNAMPLSSVRLLVDVMRDFAAKHG